MIYSRSIFFCISLAVATLLLLDASSVAAFVPGGGAGHQPSPTAATIDSSSPPLPLLLPFWGHPPSSRQYFVHDASRTQFILRASDKINNKDAENNDIPPGPVKLIIAGAPASGKGTQCEVIKEKYGVVHLSTGDMLRAAVLAGSEVGKQANAYMDSGKLVPDEVIIGVVSATYYHTTTGFACFRGCVVMC
jgi:adenylate kinase